MFVYLFVNENIDDRQITNPSDAMLVSMEKVYAFVVFPENNKNCPNPFDSDGVSPKHRTHDFIILHKIQDFIFYLVIYAHHFTRMCNVRNKRDKRVNM